jgi:CDP-glucose 4,6-dehydratase
MDFRQSPLENVVMNSTFWQNKKVLITGHTGFKGSWLALWLQQLGAKIIGFALPPPTEQNLFTLANVAQNMISIIGDIRNFSEIKQTLADYSPEIIIHMAAQPLVKYSYTNPIETYATNVMGTVHIMEAVRQVNSIKVVINVTTDKCYENKEWQWGYRENEALGGYDPYSNSKACSELVTSAYRNSYFNFHTYSHHGVSVASARAGNVIGGGDWAPNRLIPDIIRSCLAKEGDIIIRNPNAQRPWQHVLEPLSGYLLLAERLFEHPAEYAEAWNFGPNDADIQPVSYVADFLIKLLDGKPWILDNYPHAHEATYLKLDCSKAKVKLGWHPRWNLERGLKETANWYQAYQLNKNLKDVTLAQIESYI